MPDRYVGHRTPEGGWRWEPQDSPRSKGRPLLLVIGGLGAAAALVAASLGLAGTLLTSGGQDSDPSTAATTSPGPPFSLQVWNQEQVWWQTTDIDVSGPAGEAATFLLILDGSSARSRHVIVSFQCRNSRPAQLVAPSNPVAAITAPGPGRIRPDSTALAGALAAWSATFPEPPSWSPAATCSEPQTLEFAMIERGKRAYFLWEARVPEGDVVAAGADMSVEVSIDGSPAQSLTVNLRP